MDIWIVFIELFTFMSFWQVLLKLQLDIRKNISSEILAKWTENKLKSFWNVLVYVIFDKRKYQNISTFSKNNLCYIYPILFVMHNRKKKKRSIIFKCQNVDGRPKLYSLTEKCVLFKLVLLAECRNSVFYSEFIIALMKINKYIVQNIFQVSDLKYTLLFI